MFGVPSKAQRSMIPVASRSQAKCGPAAVTIRETVSSHHPTESLHTKRSKAHQGDLHTRTLSKSDSSLCEILSSENGPRFDYQIDPFAQQQADVHSNKLIQSANYSSTNLRINICHRSLKSNPQNDFEDSTDQSKAEQAKYVQIKSKHSSTEPIAEIMSARRKTCKSRSITSDSNGSTGRANSKQSINRSSSLSSGFGSSVELQLERQLQEKDLQIRQLMNTLGEKNSLTESLRFEMNRKDERIEELINEIKMRKQDMAEMSRKIISMDRELKMYQNGRKFESDLSPAERPFSGLSNASCQSEQTMTSSKWLNLFPLRLKRTQVSETVSGGKPDEHCISELKSILKEKEMIITDLRVHSKLATHKLEQMQNVLRVREEERLVMKKNHDYLEKAIKSKLLD